MRRIIATVSAVALAAVSGGIISLLPMSMASASTVTGSSGQQYQEVSFAQRFISSDDQYGSYQTRNRWVEIDVQNANPPDVQVSACVVPDTVPTGECSSYSDSSDLGGGNYQFHVDSSSGTAYIEVDYAPNDTASTPDLEKVYTMTWTAPQVLTTPPVVPTQSGNVVTIPSVPHIGYWDGTSGQLLSTGAHTMLSNMDVWAAPDDGYVFQSGDDGSEVPDSWQTGWSYLYTAPSGPTPPTGPTPPSGPTSPVHSVTVIKSAALKVRKAPTTKKAGKVTLTLVATNGAKVTGKAVLLIKKGKTIKRVHVAVHGNVTKIKVPKLKKKGVWKLRAKFQANSAFGAKNTKTYKVRVRK